MKLQDATMRPDTDGTLIKELLTDWLHVFYQTLSNNPTESVHQRQDETDGTLTAKIQRNDTMDEKLQRIEKDAAHKHYHDSTCVSVDCDKMTTDCSELFCDSKTMNIPGLPNPANCDSDRKSYCGDQSDILPLSSTMPDLLTFLPEMSGDEPDRVMDVPHIISDSSPQPQMANYSVLELPAALKPAIKELLMMCFKHDIHGNVISDFNDFQLDEETDIKEYGDDYELSLSQAVFLRSCIGYMDNCEMIEWIWQMESSCRRRLLWMTAMEHLQGQYVHL
jgi:hypothetical protein